MGGFSRLIDWVEKELGSKSSCESGRGDSSVARVESSGIRDCSSVMTWEMGERDSSREVPLELGDASSGLAIRSPPNDWERLKSPLMLPLKSILPKV